MKINLTINGDERLFDCDPHESLMTVLRREGYYSVRFGSDTGETGAAGVLVDGKLVSAIHPAGRSSLMPPMRCWPPKPTVTTSKQSKGWLPE